MIHTVFEPARRRAAVQRLRFHDLRHSYASVLIAQGVHPKVISEQLGHANALITMDRYSHLFDRAYSDVSKELEAAWAEAETASTPQAPAVQTDAAGFHAENGTLTKVPATTPI